ATSERTAASSDNPDFADVVTQSYRHRYRYAPGDPAVEPIEQALAAQPQITVPTITLHGEASGVGPSRQSEQHARFFSGPYRRKVIPKAGHYLPAEAPREFAGALLELHSR